MNSLRGAEMHIGEAGFIDRCSISLFVRRVALDFVEGTEHAFSLRHCVGMTLRSGILNDMTVRRAALLFVEALYSSSRCFTLRRGILLFVAAV